MLKTEIFTAIMESQFGHHPHATDYGPIVIGIETPRKFLCMFPDSRSVTHANFMTSHKSSEKLAFQPSIT